MTALRTYILTAVFCIASIAASAQLNDSQGLSYTTSGSTASVSGFGTTTSGAITIPGKINSYTVTSIADEALKGCTAITSITFEGNIVVGDKAFSGCTSLKTVTVAGETYFGDYTFSDDANLVTVTVKDGGSISYIGISAFNGCTKLKSIDLVGDLYDIGVYAFYGCKSLTSITTPSSLVNIGEEAFRNCTALTEINLNEGLETIGKQAFRGDALLSSLTLPATTKTIGYGAFYDNNAIKTVTVPKSVTEISEYCFYNCYALEKLYFEGGKLTTIPSRAFANCNNLEEIIIGEGITTIEESAFSSCAKLRLVTLPKTVTILGNSIFIECHALDTVKLYAAIPPETDTNTFTDLKSGVTLLVPNPDKYSSWANNFGTIGEVFTFEKEEKEEESTTKTEISTSETFSAIDVFRALSDSKGDYYDADVNMKDDIAFTSTTLDLENLSANNIFTVLDAFPYTESYNGKMAGATISNMAMRSQGVFGTIGKDAQIDGLIFQDATLYVDPTDTETYQVDGDDVTIHILAKTNNGTVTNFGFSGDIIVDEDFANGKEISVCAVNDNSSTDASISGFVRIGSLIAVGEGDTKRCITIKQNLGIKRPPGKKTKIATSKSLSTNKTTNFTYTEEELNKDIREFSDEEFASGVVAYWLNYDGPGYTGNYTGYWSQGKKVPVPATSVAGVSNYLSAVNYAATDQSHLTSAPQFANNGSQITIEYDQKPESVTIGGVAYTGFGDKSMTVTFDNTKPISIAFNKSVTAVDQPKQALKVTTAGLTATVSGAAGATIKLVSLTGKVVATANGHSITAPAKGLYMLQIDGKFYKLLFK